MSRCERFITVLSGLYILAASSPGYYADTNQLQLMSLIDMHIVNKRTTPATSLIGAQGTDWMVITNSGVPQTGFSSINFGKGYVQAIKTAHGLANSVNLQLATSGGKLILDADL